ncbi:TPA: RloB domain-containing protein [Vibrio parahaemolyticus]|uniref:RloB domain-containing protein n=1 Tax=Vibrio TaxID=662 RepID=UPI0011218A78|nr:MULTISPECIES: RloB domain-containing protein [Vibrio]EIO4085915.1 RloB domain-containing protein [Vibrio parahaemolyticus]EJG1834376.1 RloB domain-containing protein [Vibrio parahaemolyticus]ELA9336150.1 RloB domain-containing protein [Vibrio parahaemolyticus]ELB1646519.1 RloB domain-containing protein [Vibrio parahaemolyticus]ELU1680067.1 RloB domain-containing protein [Vibrio parahaemolyticus]
MSKKRTRRVVKRTLLIVGEGEAEKAFLLHLKSIYGVGDPKVSIKSAGGKGPKNVITEAITSKDANGYDLAAVFLDTDLTWPASMVKKAKGKKITLIGSSPCLEGLLLDVIGTQRPTPNSSKECKRKLHGLLKGKETARETYEELFTKDVLDKTNVEQIKTLIKLIQGKY